MAARSTPHIKLIIKLYIPLKKFFIIIFPYLIISSPYIKDFTKSLSPTICTLHFNKFLDTLTISYS